MAAEVVICPLCDTPCRSSAIVCDICEQPLGRETDLAALEAIIRDAQAHILRWGVAFVALLGISMFVLHGAFLIMAVAGTGLGGQVVRLRHARRRLRRARRPTTF